MKPLQRLVLIALVALGLTAHAVPSSDESALFPVPSARPGYSFIIGDYNRCQIVKFDADGKATWVYDKVKPIDVWAMPDGIVLTAYLPSPLTSNKGGVRLLNPDKTTVFDYPFDDEIMSVQPLANGNFLMAECHHGRITEMDRTGKRVHSFLVKSKPSGHATMRQIRLTTRGTIIVGECYSHKVREYDRAGTLLKEYDLRYAYCPQPLPNGHTLVACWNEPEAQVVELDADGKVVWSLTPAELPKDMSVTHIAGCIRLPGGNTLVSVTCKAGKGAIPRPMLFEITPDKKIVWTMMDKNSSTWMTVVKLIPSWNAAQITTQSNGLASATNSMLSSLSEIPGEILFAERNHGRDPSNHYYANFGYNCCDENEWLHGADGGRLAILNPKTGIARTLIEDPQGAFRDAAVHYDGKKVLFSYRKGGTHHYNLYEINLDSTGLKQLTSGDWDDVEPAYLPDGGIVFCSTRCKRYVLCWEAPVAILHRCNADGSGIRMLSSGAVTENTPAILPDGRILYTRWEYNHRATTSFKQLWTMNPDGTGVAAYYGNMHPDGFAYTDAKPIPGSSKVTFVYTGHCSGEHNGDIAILDVKKGPDDRSQARILVKGPLRDPFPISPDLILAARDKDMISISGLGEVKVLYTSSILPFNEPRLISARPREPVIASRVDLTQTNGTVFLTDTYIGRKLKGIKPGSVKKLLVMEQLPKPVNYHGGGSTPLAHGGKWTICRILGTVPVEPDGSANFEAPAGRSLFLTMMDENGLSIKQMRSFMTVMPGEHVSCIGCHEERTMPPPAGLRIAATRAPSKIEPLNGVPEIIDFPRDIQPILNRQCVSCHNPDKRGGGIDLCGDHGVTYSIAYYNMVLHRQINDTAGWKWAGSRHPWGEPNGNDAPYEAFSGAAPLMKKIDGSHHSVKLTPHERLMFQCWLDCATPYAGTYAAYGTGQIGAWWRNNESIREVANAWPTTKACTQAIERRCAECHTKGTIPRFVTDQVDVTYGDFEGFQRPTFRTSRHHIFNLSRPEKSLALMAPLAESAGGYGKGSTPAKPVQINLATAPVPITHPVVFTSTNDTDYVAILAHLQAAQTRLNEIKRFDMPGFQPRYEYLREMKRYGVLPADFDPKNPSPVNPYELDQKYWQQFLPRPVKPIQ